MQPKPDKCITQNSVCTIAVNGLNGRKYWFSCLWHLACHIRIIRLLVFWALMVGNCCQCCWWSWCPIISHHIILVIIIIITSLPKVIWEEGRVAALSHTYAVKSPLVTMARPKFAFKSTLSRGPIPKPHYLPHHWTRLTYDAKRHPDPIRRFSTLHWTDRRTDAPTDRSSTGKFDDNRPLRYQSDAA